MESSIPGPVEPIAGFSRAMRHRNDLHLTRLNKEMNHIVESPDDRKTNIAVGGCKLAFGAAKWVRLDAHEHLIDLLPEFNS